MLYKSLPAAPSPSSSSSSVHPLLLLGFFFFLTLISQENTDEAHMFVLSIALIYSYTISHLVTSQHSYMRQCKTQTSLLLMNFQLIEDGALLINFPSSLLSCSRNQKTRLASTQTLSPHIRVKLTL